MSLLEHMEMWSYIVTVVGLPFAILVYLREKRKERENEDEEIYQKLSDDYAEFLKLVIANSDLKLRSSHPADLSDEQRDRRLNIFDMLVSLFERAYLLAYEENMDRNKRRRWQSWEDYMKEWCCREDFRRLLPQLLEGEDAEFAAYIRTVAEGCDRTASSDRWR